MRFIRSISKATVFGAIGLFVYLYCSDHEVRAKVNTAANSLIDLMKVVTRTDDLREIYTDEDIRANQQWVWDQWEALEY